MIKIHECEQGTDVWHALRHGKYTGSNAHKLLKYGAVDHALTETSDFKGNFYTKRGHILEEEAIELYEAITKENVFRPGFITNSDYPTCGYSPDGITLNATIEVKCFNQEKHLAMYNGDIPLTVLAQLHFGMLICNKLRAQLLIYNPELDPKLAFKIIEVKQRPAIRDNFKRILNQKVPTNA